MAVPIQVDANGLPNGCCPMLGCHVMRSPNSHAAEICKQQPYYHYNISTSRRERLAKASEGVSGLALYAKLLCRSPEIPEEPGESLMYTLCMYMYIYIYIYTYVCVCIFIYIYNRTCVYIIQYNMIWYWSCIARRPCIVRPSIEYPLCRTSPRT